MAIDTILIVEDDIGILNLLSLYLKNRGFRVKGVENGEEALTIVQRKSVNLVILDIELPAINGFEVCRKIREHINVPIIFMSSRLAVKDKIKGLKLGGDDYITKPFDFGELEARIKSHLWRYEQLQKLGTHSILSFGDLVIDLDLKACFLNGHRLKLTKKELKLLIFFAQNPHKTYSIEELYDHIWGFHSLGDPQTVKVHINNLRHKIERNPRQPKLLHTVRGFGYRFSN